MDNFNHSAEEQALKDFLLDIDCLNKLNPWTKKFNLFDVLKISKTEIRHSNMLGWLLDPNENHNLQDKVIRGLVEHIVKEADLNNTDIFDILLMNYYNFKVMREWQNIDLLLISEVDKLLITIENKINSTEHTDQLNRYRKTINTHYPQYQHLFLYLTPDGDDSSDSENWQNIAYSNLVDIIENALEKSSVFADIELLIRNYIETVRWHIVGDDKLIAICNEIYKKHRRALDLIYENKADNTLEITNFIIETMPTLIPEESQFTINTDKCGKTYIRFTSQIMTQLLPNFKSESSGWKTNNHYFYEIMNKGDRLKLQLAISKGSLTDSERDDYFQKIIKTTLPNDRKANWTWKRLKSWPIMRFNEDESLDDVKDTLISKLSETLQKAAEFEQSIKLKMQPDEI